MWILLFKTVLKSHVIKPSVVRECIKERLLTLSTAVTGPNPWEENSEFSMQKVCWGLFLDQQLEGREEYRWGRGALLLVTRETLQVLRSSGAEAALLKGSKPLPPCTCKSFMHSALGREHGIERDSVPSLRAVSRETSWDVSAWHLENVSTGLKWRGDRSS